MKIAVFHNFLDNIGGAEVVTLTLARELNADVYTTNINRAMIKKMGFDTVRIHSIGRVPVNAPFRQQLALLRFHFLRLTNKYDCYIISGDWSVSGALHNKPNVWYVHSPIREIWDSYEYVRAHMVAWYKRPLFDVWVWFNRLLNHYYVKQVGRFVCNSHNTQKRLKTFLNKDAVVIHPPIETGKFYCGEQKGYWLSVNRLTPAKRIDVQLEAFASMPEEKLVIVGSYEQSTHFLEEVERLEEMKPKNVEIKHWISKEELQDLYAHAKGFIATALDEDFGMTVVEAMAAGKPVIASYEGGYKESVREGVTGLFLKETTPEALITAVRTLSQNTQQYKDACIAHARQYDTTCFVEKIKDEVAKAIKQYE